MRKNTVVYQFMDRFFYNPCQTKLYFSGQAARHKLIGYLTHVDNLEDFLLFDSRFVIINITMCFCFLFPTWPKGQILLCQSIEAALRLLRYAYTESFIEIKQLSW